MLPAASKEGTIFFCYRRMDTAGEGLVALLNYMKNTTQSKKNRLAEIRSNFCKHPGSSYAVPSTELGLHVLKPSNTADSLMYLQGMPLLEGDSNKTAAS